MFKQGSIRKIDVTNFVTFTHATLHPGPNLNMLVGPNGTGKSTMVAAIILGLGGNPKIVGRGSRVSEYVKHNCDRAIIHIYLQGETEDKYTKITRTITIQDKTVWHLNNKQVHQKDIINCVTNYKIQVDNLCQMLPQDRVQEFAKLNQQHLLKETQLALGRKDLVDALEALIRSRDSRKGLTEAIERDDAKLLEIRDANLRLEGKIKNFEKKKKFISRLDDIDRKISWTFYEELEHTMSDTKNELERIKKENLKLIKKYEPVEKQIYDAKKLVTELQKDGSNLTRATREHETSFRNLIAKVDQIKQQLRDVDADRDMKLAEAEQSKQEMEAWDGKIEEMKKRKQELIKQWGSDETLREQTENLTAQMQELKRHIDALQNQKDKQVNIKQTNMAQMRAYQSDRRRMENVGQKKLECLRKMDEDAYKGVIWLREHKEMFKGQVFEPIMLEINVHDSKYATYLENSISFRDKIAFSCVDKDDMNTLIKCLREEKGLTINVIHSRDVDEINFTPEIPIAQLRRFGLYVYLNSLFTAPTPIMNYLCKNYKLHNIPIGDRITNSVFDKIPQQIRTFFSDTQRFTVTISRYSGERSTKQNEFTSDGTFSTSIDTVHLTSLTAKINQLGEKLGPCEDKIKEFDDQMKMVGTQLTQLTGKLKNIHAFKQQKQEISERIVTMTRRGEQMKKRDTNVEAIKTSASTKAKKLVKPIGPIVSELKSIYKTIYKLNIKKQLNELKIQEGRRHAAYLENKAVEARRLLQQSETDLNEIKEKYASDKGQAKAALQKAKNLSKGFTPDSDGFAEFREMYDSLSSDLDQLNDEKDKITAKIDCLHSADDAEMRAYDERVKQIEQLEKRIEENNVKLSVMSGNLEQMMEKWLDPLRKLVAQINQKFSNLFERLGCAGEVSLKTGGSETDFENYGLAIKVTYRNGEPLQELNCVVQSGGERAVATALFMLSLQESTPVPFRCVDEINQGMDVKNEKKVVEMLMEYTGQMNTAQYFLITPKLIPNLQYSEHTIVHIVQNGPFIEADRKWEPSRICNPQGFKIH